MSYVSDGILVGDRATRMFHHDKDSDKNPVYSECPKKMTVWVRGAIAGLPSSALPFGQNFWQLLYDGLHAYHGILT